MLIMLIYIYELVYLIIVELLLFSEDVYFLFLLVVIDESD